MLWLSSESIRSDPVKTPKVDVLHQTQHPGVHVLLLSSDLIRLDLVKTPRGSLQVLTRVGRAAQEMFEFE